MLILEAGSVYSQQDSLERGANGYIQQIGISADSTIGKYSGLIEKKTNEIVTKKDNVISDASQISEKYFTAIDKKVEKYAGRITRKTEKTLEKLSKWENKIKTALEKTSPEAVQRLFGNNQLTFSSMLQKLKSGENITKNYRKQYDAYKDKLTTSLKYLDTQKEQLDRKLMKPLSKAKAGLDSLSKVEDNTEALQQIIKERKKQLLEGAFNYLGKSKYFSKINKEAWYYTETIKNYKEIFKDEEKVEKIAKEGLEKIPGFKDFLSKNSQLSGIFSSAGSSPGTGNENSMPVINGLPNRAEMQGFLQKNIPALTNPVKQMQIPDAKEEFTKWQNKINEKGGMGNKDLPDFTPNKQKTKLFRQRLEFGGDLQFKGNNNLLPASANVSLKAGYKLSDKNTVGIGLCYSLGLGEGWDKIKFSHEGFGIRTYAKWKIKKFLDIQGGAEWNHLKFQNFASLKNSNQWQQSALLGINKSYSVSKKTKGSVQILYDFLYKSHAPVSQPILFRFGYDLK